MSVVYSSVVECQTFTKLKNRSLIIQIQRINPVSGSLSRVLIL